MSKIIFEVPPKPFWEQPEEATNAYTLEAHDPLERLFIVWINPHPNYPTKTCGGYYSTFEDAKKSLLSSPYGGEIEETTWGEMNRVFF